MIQRLKLIAQFYKQFVLASIAINLLLLLFSIGWFSALIAKFVFIGILFWGIFTTDRKFQLDFYRNLKLSPSRLFLGILCFDFFLLVLFYILVK